MNLGRKLRVMRVERGLTLREAGQLVGVAYNQLSLLETGRHKPHDLTLAKIAKGYGVSLEDLLDAKDGE